MAAMPQCIFTLATRMHYLIDDADLKVTYGRAIEISDKVAAGRDSSEWVSDGASNIGPDSEPCAIRLLTDASRMRHHFDVAVVSITIETDPVLVHSIQCQRK